MNKKLSKKEDLFLVPREELNLDQIKLLLEMFSFEIPEEQLPFIKIENIEEWRINFTNTKTNEKYSGFYTDACPSYAGNPTYYGESERFLGQKIISNDAVTVNWFYVKGDRVACDDFMSDPKYIPPFYRDRELLLEKVLLESKNNDGEFVLEIQKDFPHSDKRKNLEVVVYSGNLESVCPCYAHKELVEAKTKNEIIKMKYGRNKDYNYYETGSLFNCGDLNEIRYIYGRNMQALTDYEYNKNVLTDNRVVYGVTHKEKGINYYGVIAEDGSRPFDIIMPIGWTNLSDSFIEYEKDRPQSKIYFRINETYGNPKYLGIIKTKEGNIKAFIDEVQYNSKAASYEERVKTIRLEDYEVSSKSDGILTREEIELAMQTLQGDKKDKYLECIANELEIYFERKNERKELSEMEFEISDICNPNLTVNFDTDLIINMVRKQGIGASISSIISHYATMFKNDRQTVINANRIDRNQGINKED